MQWWCLRLHVIDIVQLAYGPLKQCHCNCWWEHRMCTCCLGNIALAVLSAQIEDAPNVSKDLSGLPAATCNNEMLCVIVACASVLYVTCCNNLCNIPTCCPIVQFCVTVEGNMNACMSWCLILMCLLWGEAFSIQAIWYVACLCCSRNVVTCLHDVCMVIVWVS